MPPTFATDSSRSSPGVGSSVIQIGWFSGPVADVGLDPAMRVLLPHVHGLA